MKNLGGKVAFVTGGASGVGYGMVRSFLKEGMRVVVADCSQVHLDELREDLAGSNAVHFVQVDVADRDGMRAAVEDALSAFGKIHLLCNNAGVGGGGTVDGQDFDDWDKAMAINLGGVVNGVKIVAPIIKKQGEGGHIVNTASMSGMVPLPGLGAYVTAKYAVRGLSDSLRMTLAPEGIGVSCLFPGLTRSRILEGMLIEAERTGAPEEQIDFFKMLLRDAMDPLELGAMVIEGIRNNAPYICTHEEFLEEVRAMHARIEDSFPSGQPIPEGRRAFEANRRSQADALNALPAKD